MRYKKIKLSAAFLFIIGLTRLLAQTAIPGSGGDASGSNGTFSYSVGQIVYTSNTGTNGSAAQGVQQPFEISVLTGIEEALGISLQFSVYPNPAIDFIKVKIENYEVENIRYQLFDINGYLILNNLIEGNETNISMQHLKPAVYLLKILQGKREIKTFKVIKN